MQVEHQVIGAQICSVHLYSEIKINAQLIINATPRERKGMKKQAV